MKRVLVWFLGLGLVLTGVNPSWADSAPARMDAVIVTATRTREEIRNVPNTVTVIGPAEIEASSARNVGELLKGSLGLEINSYGPLGAAQSVSIRGSSASQVLVMVDGRPINSITFGSSDLSEIPIEQIERVEVVKGPTSHLYGANAMGGVINIITKKATAASSLKAGVSYGSFNTQTYSAEHGQQLDRFSYLLTGGYKVSDGFRDNSAYKGKDFSSKLSYQASERLSMSLLTVVHQDGLGVPGPKPPAGTVPLFGNSEVTSLFDHQDNTLFNNNLNLSWEPHDKVQVSGQVYQDWRELKYRQKYSLFTTAVEDNSTYRAGIWGGNIILGWNLPYQNKLILGTDYRKEDLEAETITTDLSTSITSATQWKPDNSIWGFFAQDHWQALSWLRLAGGVRYDRTSRYGSETSPDFGLVLSPLKETRIKAHYGQAFRPPTFNDLFWPNFGNTQLKPEKGTSYEVNWEQGLLDQKVQFTLGVFRWEVTDKIEWVPDATGTWKPQNVNEQNTWGSEIGFQWSPLKEVTLSLGYTYLDSKQKNQEVQDALTGETALVERRAASVPKHQGRLTLGYRMPWGTQAFLTGRYVGDRVFYYSDYTNFPTVSQQEKSLGSYYTVDLKLSHLFAQHWQATVSLLNLTNQQYDAQPGTSFLDRNYPAPGIAATVGLTYIF
jgi:outer membrane cobalamin receptor